MSLVSALELVAPLIFIALFALTWVLVLRMLARLGGWYVLAQHYLAPGTPHGQQMSWHYGRIGGMWYRGALNLWSSPAGVYLGVLLPFRIGHPLLFIPKAALCLAPDPRAVGRHGVELIVAGEPPVDIKLPRQAVEAMGFELGNAAGPS